MFAAKMPPGASVRAASAVNSTDVRWAGVRPPLNTSAITTSREPAGIWPSAARASATRISIWPSPGGSGSRPRTKFATCASASIATWQEPGRVAAT